MAARHGTLVCLALVPTHDGLGAAQLNSSRPTLTLRTYAARRMQFLLAIKAIVLVIQTKAPELKRESMLIAGSCWAACGIFVT